MSQPWFKPAKTDAEKLAEAQAKKIREINEAYTAEAEPLIKEYPAIEQQTWLAQESEARAYLAWLESQQGDVPEMPVLDAILLGRNGDGGTETIADLCNAVIDNADRFTAFQRLTGKRQRLVKTVKSAPTDEAVNTVRW